MTLKGGKGNDYLENRGGNNVTMDPGPGHDTLEPEPLPVTEGTRLSGEGTRLSGVWPRQLTGTFGVVKSADNKDYTGFWTTQYVSFTKIDAARFILPVMPSRTLAVYKLSSSLSPDEFSTSKVVDPSSTHHVYEEFNMNNGVGSVGPITSDVSLKITPSHIEKVKSGKKTWTLKMVPGHWFVSGTITLNYTGVRTTTDDSGDEETEPFPGVVSIPISADGVTKESGPKNPTSKNPRHINIDFPTHIVANPSDVLPAWYDISIHLAGK